MLWTHTEAFYDRGSPSYLTRKLTSAKQKNASRLITPYGPSIKRRVFSKQDWHSARLRVKERRHSEKKVTEMCYLYRRTRSHNLKSGLDGKDTLTTRAGVTSQNSLYYVNHTEKASNMFFVPPTRHTRLPYLVCSGTR